MEYELIRSDRRTLGVEVKRDGTVIVRAPRRLPQREIDRFLRERADWIQNAQNRQRSRAESRPEPTEQERSAYIRKAKELLPGKVAYWSKRMGLYPTQIRITGARTRFGSCSSQGHICFSWRLMQYPDAAIDYVVVHELAHLRHMNHSKAFYGLVEQYLPDWRQRKALLKS